MKPDLKQTPSTSVEFIRTHFLQKKKLNPQYSVPAFARDLGISKSFLWRLLKGDRPLTVKQAIQMSVVFGMSAQETDELIAKLVLESDKNAKVSNALRKKISERKSNADAITHLEVEKFKAISAWHHLAILNLTRLKDFESSASAIAKRIGISVTEARDAIDRLRTLGLLKLENGKLTRTKGQLFVDTQKASLGLTQYYDQTLDCAKQANQKNTEADFERRFFASVTLPVNAEKIEKLKARLQEVQNEFMEPVTATDLTDVYQINFQLFPLTERNSKS